MAQETRVIIDTSCDLCAVEDRRTMATDSYAVTLAPLAVRRMQHRRLDTCDEHRSQLEYLYRIVTNLARADGGGRTHKDTTAAPLPPEPCPLCAGTFGHLTEHLRTTHCDGMPYQQPDTCPDCGTVKAPRAMSVHRATAHGWRAHDEYLRMARGRMASTLAHESDSRA